ncbi:MAG: TetR/AcrR family transcriptional regulator [Candidatus Kapaibacterium sp.]
MGTTERRERERKEMRDLILKKAMELFLSEGYENVSMRKIADAIEYSPGTIYLYFSDRDEIIFALHHVAFQKFYKALSVMAGDGDPWERLVKGGRAYIRFALANPGLYELMFIMNSPAKTIKAKDKWEEGMNSFGLLSETVRECVDAGKFPADTDVPTAALYFWGMCHGLVSLAIRNRLPMIPKSQIRGVLEAAFNFGIAKME